jgi:2-aminobenzoate-CoA ligase
MKELPVGGVGRLAVRGPTGCRYLSDNRQNDYVVDGWNITGDSFYKDNSGYFYFTARNDDMIISSGYNIAGPEVESALISHEAVFECAVIAFPDKDRGSIVQAYIVLNDPYVGDNSLKKILQDYVKSIIAPFKYPRSIIFIDTLPKTKTGKIQRFLLRKNN